MEKSLKLYSLSGLLMILLGSCVQKSNNANYRNFVSEMDKKNSVAIDSLDTLANTLLEKNLKVQLNDFLRYSIGDSIDKALDLIYPDVYTYLIDKYPDEARDLETAKSTMRNFLVNFKRNLETQEDVTLEFQIGDINKRIDLGKDKIYTVYTHIITRRGMDALSKGGEVICVSNDHGRTWTFMEKSKMVEEVLKMKYSEAIVKRVMKPKI